MARHRLSIGGLIFLCLSIVYGRRRFLRNRAVAAQIPGLVDQVLERLSAQKEAAFDSDNEEDAFLFLPNLRDDVLRALHSLAERERLWTRVRAVVEQNSNVRTGQREGRNGEVGRAWEWIGPSRIGGVGEGVMGGGGGRARRKSARVSWGADVKGEVGEEQTGVVPQERRAMHRKWEEGGRPIF